MKPRVVAAGEFRSRCLSLIDEVQATGQEILVIKRGRPVVRVVPNFARPRASLLGSILWRSDDFEEPLNEPWFPEPPVDLRGSVLGSRPCPASCPFVRPSETRCLAFRLRRLQPGGMDTDFAPVFTIGEAVL
jgi:prevent-host-death family protein